MPISPQRVTTTKVMNAVTALPGYAYFQFASYDPFDHMIALDAIFDLLTCLQPGRTPCSQGAS